MAVRDLRDRMVRCDQGWPEKVAKIRQKITTSKEGREARETESVAEIDQGRRA